MAEAIYYPPGTESDFEGRTKALLVVCGTAGVGKSHLVTQLTHDTRYGPDEVLVLMAEDSTATYGKPLPRIVRCDTIASAKEKVDDLIIAGAKGARLPRIVVLDSLSGICDYQMSFYKKTQPFVGPRTGGRDKLAEYGDIGEQAVELVAHLRDKMPMDCVVLVTTFEPGGAPPELAIPGKVIPKNLARLSSCTFYMKAEVTPKLSDEDLRFAREHPESVAAPHRTLGRDDTGALDGTMINRYFITMNTGEVVAKGHHNLFVRERAILPEVLDKIHGVVDTTTH